MTLVIAHRGASGYAPENTLRAFALAQQQGADMIELDVQRSADGVLVVFHDDTTERWDGRPRAVPSCTLAELHALDIGGERVATLEETCAFARASGMALNVELKQPDIVAPVVELLRHYEIAERVLISSFYYDALAALQSAAPDIAGAYLLEEAPEGFDGHSAETWPLPLLREVGARAWHPYAHLPALEQLLPAVRAAGYAVNVWTVNDAALAERLAGWGASGIFTDFPDVIRSALDAERGV